MKFFWSFLLLSSFVCCVGETFKHPVKCISHQGERFDAPIHSAPAYRLAMERKADLMKIDVHYTRDAVPVLSHDGTLKRTMNWNVRIKDKTLEEFTHRENAKVMSVCDKKLSEAILNNSEEDFIARN